MKRQPSFDLTPPPKVRGQATPKNIVHVAMAWSSPDSWDVEHISIETLRQLIEALEAGDSPQLLAAHADHFSDDCAREACQTLLTFCGAD